MSVTAEIDKISDEINAQVQEMTETNARRAELMEEYVRAGERWKALFTGIQQNWAALRDLGLSDPLHPNLAYARDTRLQPGAG